LIQFLRAYGIKDGDEVHKDRMRTRIMQGPPYSAEEYELFKRYCLDDVRLLELLMQAMVPHIRNFKQALHYGEFVKFTAEIFARGISGDPWSTGLLKDAAIRKALRLRAVSNTDLTYGLYQGTAELTQEHMREFVIRHKLKGWRMTGGGKKGQPLFGTKGRDFERLEEQFPKRFDGLADIHKTVKQLHEMQLFTGADHRYRTPLWAFSTITSRAAPNGAAYPFTCPSGFRPTMMAREGRALLYLDFSSMEFGVAAGLSQCPLMLADYEEEPYLVLPILAGELPPGATKKTHHGDREAYKPMILAVQYGGGASLLAYRLKKPRPRMQRIVDLHHERYAGYWEWSDTKLLRAFGEGELVSPDGWRCGVNSLTPLFTARNWLIQTIAQAIFRYAGLLMRALALPVVGLVHDAVLIECGVDEVDHVQALAVECLERASRRFLRGLTLRAEGKPLMPGERFIDPRGAKLWAFIEQSLRELERSWRHAG
jgi:hypothetical protein